MSATFGGQAAHWFIAPATGPRAQIPQPEETPPVISAPQAVMTSSALPETPAMSLDLPRFFYELEAFFQSAKKIEAALNEERRANAELRAQMKRQEVEQERKLADTQERLRVLTEQTRKAHDLVQSLQAQGSKSQGELHKAREQWRLNHEKAQAASVEVQSRGKRIEELERQLTEARTSAEQNQMDSNLAAHEKETELRTLSYERDGLNKKLRDLEIRFGQVEHRYKTEKDARERIEAYAKNCYQELLKERARASFHGRR